MKKDRLTAQYLPALNQNSILFFVDFTFVKPHDYERGEKRSNKVGERAI
jgi:hypothetical protein